MSEFDKSHTKEDIASATHEELYKEYCKYNYNKHNPFIVSKSYFEEYMSNT